MYVHANFYLVAEVYDLEAGENKTEHGHGQWFGGQIGQGTAVTTTSWYDHSENRQLSPQTIAEHVRMKCV